MRAAALVLVLTVATAACGGDTELAPETTTTTEFVPGTLPERLLADFRSEEMGLSLRFPVDWLPEEDPDAGFVGFTAPPVAGDSFVENFNVVVVDLPDGITLSHYVAQDSVRLAGSIDDYEVIGGYTGEMAGQEASAVAFTGTTEGIGISVLRVVTIAGGRGIEFTFLASEDEFENFVPVIEQLVDGVELIG